jgi:hypothetical protein
VKRGDNTKIDGILHYVAQNNPVLANSKTVSNDIIHELKIQMQYQSEPNSLKPEPNLSIYLSGLVTAVAVFRNPSTIPFCLTTALLLNVLFSWQLVHLPSTFFLGKE